MKLDPETLTLVVNDSELKLIADALLDWPGDFNHVWAEGRILSLDDLEYRHSRLKASLEIGRELKQLSIAREFQPTI